MVTWLLTELQVQKLMPNPEQAISKILKDAGLHGSFRHARDMVTVTYYAHPFTIEYDPLPGDPPQDAGLFE